MKKGSNVLVDLGYKFNHSIVIAKIEEVSNDGLLVKPFMVSKDKTGCGLAYLSINNNMLVNSNQVKEIR